MGLPRNWVGASEKNLDSVLLSLLAPTPAFPPKALEVKVNFFRFPSVLLLYSFLIKSELGKKWMIVIGSCVPWFSHCCNKYL